MNPALQCLFARRSVRKYTNREVPDSVVRDLLEAAMAAPSAVAKDPWHFIVVRDAATRAKIADGLPNGQMLRQSPVGIVVCGDIEKAHDRQESFMLQDCSAAIENLLVAAGLLGLGACWLGVHPRPERVQHIRALFRLEPRIVPLAVIALGYPDESPAPRTRYQESAVHKETWKRT
jgi:nitroreductase